MEYRLRFTEITTLRPYMFIVIGFLVGCVMAWLIINREKNSELEKFLIISMNYFGFRPIKKVKWRTWTNICNIWYSK